MKKQKKSIVKRKMKHVHHKSKTVVQQPAQSMQELQMQSQQETQTIQQQSQQDIHLEELRVGMHPHHKRVYVVAALIMLLLISLLLYNSFTKGGKDISGKAIGDGCNDDAGCNADDNEFCDLTKPEGTFAGTCQAKPVDAGDDEKCEDSDGNSINEKGITTKGVATQTDYCASEIVVNEFVCVDNEITSKEIQCDDGYKCEVDKCVEKPKETCNDGIKNQDESDIDCGGDSCPDKCVDGNTCKYDQDCQSSYCFPGVCAEKPAPIIPEAEPQCEDSDNGKNYDVKGTAVKGTNSKEDWCNPANGLLMEVWCENNKIKYQTGIQCSEKIPKTYCNDGACVVCTLKEKVKTCEDSNLVTTIVYNEKIIDDYGCSDQQTSESCEFGCDAAALKCNDKPAVPEPKDEPVSQPIPKESCVDSDGGIVFETKGLVTITGEIEAITKEDNCYGTPLSGGPNKGKQYLIEYYCEDNNQKQTEKLCICEAGACKVEESQPEPVQPKEDAILCEEYSICISAPSTPYKTGGQTFYKHFVQKIICDDLSNKEQVIIKECKDGCDQNFQCVEDAVAQPIMNSCVDTDLTDNPYVAGEVNFAGKKSIDKCLEGTFVKYYCDDQANIKSAEPITCELGCKDGACVVKGETGSEPETTVLPASCGDDNECPSGYVCDTLSTWTCVSNLPAQPQPSGEPTPQPVDPCANGVQDPDEDGIDCGNICPAVCPETPSEPAQQLCEDSDGGKFADILGKVTIDGKDTPDSCSGDKTKVVEQSCSDVDQLVTNEIACQDGYACDGGKCIQKSSQPVDPCANGVQDPDEDGIDCGNICPNECAPITEQLSCVESDKVDETKKGTIILQTGSTYSDFCTISQNSGTKVESSEYVYEYYCNLDGSSATKIQKCIEGTFCIDGECKKINDKCNDGDKTYIPYLAGFEKSYNAGSIYEKSSINGINLVDKTEKSESDYCTAEGKLAEGVCNDKDYYSFEEINCPTGYKCGEGICTLDSGQQDQVLLCKDTDAANAETIKGEVFVTDAEGTSTKAGEDKCDGSKIIETTCSEAGVLQLLAAKDCSANTVCQSGVCVAVPESCSDVTQCPINYNCDKITSKCVKIPGLCSNSNDCADSEECLQNKCVKMPESCTDVSQCPISFTCNANNKKCEKVPGYCDTAANCLATQECKTNVCVCPDGSTLNSETQKCEVVPVSCTEDIQCAAGKVCKIDKVTKEGLCSCGKPEKEGQYCGEKNTLYEKELNELTCAYESKVSKVCGESELCMTVAGVGSCVPITIACVDNKLVTTNTETKEEISSIICPETCADNQCVCAEGTKYDVVKNICDNGKPNLPASGKAYLDLDKEDKDENNFLTVNVTDPDGILSIQVFDAKGVEEHKESCNKEKECLVPSAALITKKQAIVLSKKVCSLTTCTEDKVTIKVTDAKLQIYTITLNQKNKFYFDSKDWTVDDSQFTTNYDSLNLQLCGCPKPVAPATDGNAGGGGGGGSSGGSCSAQYNDAQCQIELEKQSCLVGIKTYQCPSTNSCKKDKKIEKVCSALFVPPLVNKCFNKQQDDGEQGVDCGGDCKACPPVAQTKVQGLAPAKTQNGQGFVGQGLELSGDGEDVSPDEEITDKTDKEKKPKNNIVWYLLILAFVVVAMLVFIAIKRKHHGDLQADQSNAQQQVQQKPMQSQQAPLQKAQPAQPLVAPPKIAVQQPVLQAAQRPAQVQQQTQQVSQQQMQMQQSAQQSIQQPQMSAVEQAKFDKLKQDKLKQYAQMELQKGFTKEQVKQKLMSVGWKEEMVEHILQ
ncbi:hypothetical protein HZA96_07295 [Candidatus Woesearchaeota archaeon]|nr:hypothetical protein [Candidatus Woesearchaeota archaeon]